VLRFAFLAVVVASSTLFGCSAPAPAETTVSLVSERSLLDADIRIGTPVARGNNELFVQLRPHAPTADGSARLLAVDATMAAHAHEAHAEAIDETDAGFYAKKLDLFMTGRWLVTLELAFADEPDRVSLPIDVP
jgi:hypothetical protein